MGNKKQNKKIPILNDYIFKKIFGKKGNEEILKDFLLSILEIPIEKIEVQTEVSLEKELEKNKLGRLDIVAILDNRTIVNIEVQVVNQYNFIDRSLYYWAGNYYNNLNAGEEYQTTKKTISVNILNYELIKDGECHEIVKLRRNWNNEILTDKLEMHYIQIPKFQKEKQKINPKLEQWLYFITQKEEGEVKRVMKENPEIKKANEEYEYLTGEEAERRIAFLREKAIKDEKSAILGAREEGITKGIEEGKKENKKEVAKKLLKRGMTIEEVAEISELEKKEIEKLIEK